jgi:hypothetical protein
MNLLKRSALALSMMAVLNLPGAVLAEESPKEPAKLEPIPATQSAPAALDDMQSMRERMQEMKQAQGMGPGKKCDKPGGHGHGPGMMMQGGGMGGGMGPMAHGKHCDKPGGHGMGMGGGMGQNCHRMGDGQACGCEHGKDLEKRLDDLEKRLDMMQMMLKMMMR